MHLKFNKTKQRFEVTEINEEEKEQMTQMAIRSIMGRMVIFNADHIDEIKNLLSDGAYVDSKQEFADEAEENDGTGTVENKETKNIVH